MAAAVAVLLAVVFVRVLPRLGTEFLPYMDEGVIWVRANFPEGTSIEQTARFGKRVREILLEFPELSFATVQSGRNDSGTDPFPPSRMEMMVGPKPRTAWTRFHDKHELVAAMGKKLRDEFPTTRFNFTQPIIDSVTEDTNGTSANLAVEFSGPNMDMLLKLARQTVEMLKKVPGAIDVSIEQEGPQPQLVIVPDRALIAKYNVRIDDVMQLINTALGGEPVGTALRRRAALRHRRQARPQRGHFARGDRTPAGLQRRRPARPAFASGQDQPRGRADDHRSREWPPPSDGPLRHQRARPGRLRGRGPGTLRQGNHGAGRLQRGMAGHVRESGPRAVHFLVLIPLTIGLIFVLLWVTFRSWRAAVVVLLAVPFACIGGVLALYVRGMHLNMSSAVGFTALFGVAIMDGVLMVRWISTLRVQGMGMEEAILEGALERLRPILMTSIVAIFGLLPASLATGLGSDVQRPLATVIVWGLFSSTTLTLFVVPVFYRMFAPALPRAVAAAETSEAEARALVEPLPDVGTAEIIGMIEHLHSRGGKQDVFHICDEMNRSFASIISVLKAAEMLGFIDTPGHMVVLEPLGNEFAEAGPERRRALWRDQLLTLQLFRSVYEVVQRSPEHAIDRDFVLETIVTRMPYENYERIFNTFVRWSRFGDLFHYEEAVQQITLGEPPTSPATAAPAR